MKLEVYGYGVTYDIIELTEEETNKILEGEIELSDYQDELENAEDPMFTAFGSLYDSSRIEVADDDGNVIKVIEMDDIEQHDEGFTAFGPKSSTALAVVSGEKGLFHEWKLDIDPEDFDEELLQVLCANMDELISDDLIVIGAYYDGEELESNDTSTRGQSMTYTVFRTNDGGGLDTVVMEE